MNVYELRRELWVPYPLPVVVGLFARAENVERITPPWLRLCLQVARDLARIFDYRAQRVQALL